MIKYRLWLLCGLLVLSACVGPIQKPTSSDVKIIVLHSNDIHGRAWPFKNEKGNWVGGYAAQAHLIQNIRTEAAKEGAVVLVLSAGDVNTGVPESDFSEARPDFEAMQLIPYDAMAVGNHDLDHGLPLLQKQLQWVQFPLLAANLRSAQTGKPLFNSSTVITKSGLRFGILGITTDELTRLIFSEFSKPLIVDDSIRAAQREVLALKQKGADVLIALSHLGLSETGLSLHRLIVNDDQKLAQQVPELDLIVGGHSHTYLQKGLKQGKTWIVQAGYRGEFLGRVDLTWNPESKKIVSSQAQLLEVNPEAGVDTTIQAQIEPYRKKFEADLGVPIFEAKRTIIGQRNQAGTLELPLGNLICDALRSETKTEIAFFNTGGLRSSLAQGIVKKRDLLEAFPFRNLVAIGTLTGSQIISLLNDGLRGGNFAGGVLQVSGLSYSIKNGKIDQVLMSGRPIVLNKTYSFSTNSYVVAAGDKLKTMKQAKNVKTGPQTVDAILIQFGKKNKVLDASIEGRIILSDSTVP